MRGMGSVFDQLGGVIAALWVPAAIIAAVGSLSTVAFVSEIGAVGGRRRTARATESLFVGRNGDRGPELFLVGKRVRRLARVEEDDWLPPLDEPGLDSLTFASWMLRQVMYCRPAARLARDFADAHLVPCPDDGFVMPARDVEAWLAGRHGGPAPSGEH